MNKGKYVFSQLLSFLDPFVFLRISKKYGGDKYVKTFSCWNQLAVMMFGQLSNRESLRDLVLATQAHANKAFRLGFGKAVTKSNLSKANNNRDYRIFAEFAYRVMSEARQCRATEIFKLGGKVYAFDSSTIDLCLSVFGWALFRKRKGGIKLHTLYDIETQIPTFFHITPARIHDTRAMDAIPYEENSFYIFDRAYNDFGRLFTINGVGAYFVVRGKKNNDFKPMRWKRRLPAGVLSDAIGYMAGQLTMSKYPEKIRRILYLDPESGRTFIFFTNALNINPLKVAELYHNRWQIELFFKWLKQHLKIKKFWGVSENAVRIQIYTAVTAYCMMAIVQKKMDVQRSIYEMLQLVSVSLTDTVELKALFCKPNCNIVNELNDSSEPTLF
ncbi:MAG: IS4 family transposase [Candidatus Paraprevotella stercoravium]|uniref:IS4 family transposase n=1 Tax=Candidatus Paraprevotella stercoravium TaxID=2838725 RepID=A0A9E2L8M3_9BACT|nr:IS4 family transposase [Candidatus Paraprevotella stercoravium]